jgi:hypothetical protein
MSHHQRANSIEPIFNIGTIHRRISTVINISPAHCDRTLCMSVWTGQDRTSKLAGHVRPDRIKSKNIPVINISPAHCDWTPCMSVWTGQDRIKSKNPTNASLEDNGKILLEVPSFRKLDVMKLSELVDHEDKIM